MTDDSAAILSQSFSAGGPCEQFWHGQEFSLFDVVHPAFPLPTTALPTLHGALKEGFEEAVVALNMPEPCKNHAIFRSFIKMTRLGKVTT